jgi:hypothetical protein
VLSEESEVNEAPRVKDINQRVCILAQGSCVDYKLVAFGESLQKKLCAWSHKHKHLADLTLNLHRDNNIGLLWERRRLEARVHKSFIQVKRKSLLAL